MPIGDARGHGRCDPQRFMDADEIIVGHEQRDRMGMVLNLRLRRRRLGDWIRPRVLQGDKGRHEQHQSRRRAAD
jgi:hypothetical protein